EIVGKGGAGHAAAAIEHPERHGPAIEVDGPALARVDLEEVEARGRGASQPVGRLDDVEIAQGRAVAREQQMVAVVDGTVEARIVEGAGAAASLRGLLVDDHLGAALGERDGGGKAGEPGSDDVDTRHGSAARHAVSLP